MWLRGRAERRLSACALISIDFMRTCSQRRTRAVQAPRYKIQVQRLFTEEPGGRYCLDDCCCVPDSMALGNQHEHLRRCESLAAGGGAAPLHHQPSPRPASLRLKATVNLVNEVHHVSRAATEGHLTAGGHQGVRISRRSVIVKLIRHSWLPTVSGARHQRSSSRRLPRSTGQGDIP
jgi:hypothetical protein